MMTEMTKTPSDTPITDATDAALAQKLETENAATLAMDRDEKMTKAFARMTSALDAELKGPEQKHPIRKATFNVMNPRPSEVVGAGFFVFRRGERTNRIRPSLWPFEHGTLAEAVAQADALASGQPGATFVVVQHAYAACTPAPEVTE